MKLLEASKSYHQDDLNCPVSAPDGVKNGGCTTETGGVTEEPRCGIRNIYGDSNGEEQKGMVKTNLFDPKNKERFANFNIVHGNNTEKGEFPWQISFRKKSTKENFCGGALIDRDTIVTAAHCFVSKVPGGKLKFGTTGYDYSHMQFKVAVGWTEASGG